jgi:hypothetical protein
MSEPWFFMRSGVKVGPLSEQDFRAIVQRGEVQDTDPVWTRGLPTWTPLARVRGHILPARQEDPLAAMGIAPINLEADVPTLDTLRTPAHPQPAAAVPQDLHPHGGQSLAALGIAPINLESGYPKHADPIGEATPPGPRGATPASLVIAPIDLGMDLKPRAIPGQAQRSYPLEPGDRVARALFVAVAVGLAWGIRGDFGHLLGAMYPGAVLLLALAYVTGQESALRSMPALAAASALGIGLGGNMSYGLLHGYAQADTFRNYSYGLFTLLLEGGAWGFFGGAFVGMMLERDRAKWTDWAGGILAAIAGGLLFFWLVNQAFGFDINPPRSNDALAHVGGAFALFAWFAYRRLPIAFRGAMLGFIGFGLGMAGGRIVGNIFHNLESVFTINHWNTMEVTCGLVGGFVFAFGMLGVRFRDRASDRPLTAVDVAGALFVLGIIPLMHRLTRLGDDDIAGWTQKLAAYGSAWTADGVLQALIVIVLLGFAGAGVWIYLQRTGKERWGYFPVLWMSLVMLLFQNLRALYFFTPAQPGYVNMHSVFWLLLLAMAAYVGVREYLGGHSDDCNADEESDQVPWKPWLGVSAAAMTVILLAASVVNGPTTMKNAATRWPVWQWNQPAAPEVPQQ